jgi:carboxylesterase type B
LNVFTPTTITSLLPILVFIHGGGFTFGSGDTDLLGPESFVEENVLVVTINYRLGVLGFLNTGDRHSPGNFGLKDQILALRWIQENVLAFGGNPKSVSIMGSSAGSASVHALVLSPAAKGLFHRAISQSGSIFSDWTFNYNPRQTVENIARALYLHYENNEDLIRQLRNVSMERLVAAGNVFDKTLPHMIERGSIVPSLDPIDTEEVRIFPDLPLKLLHSGDFSRVPYLLGHASMENLQFIAAFDRLVVERYAQNLNLFVPALWNLRPNSPEALEVISDF